MKFTTNKPLLFTVLAVLLVLNSRPTLAQDEETPEEPSVGSMTTEETYEGDGDSDDEMN